MKVSVVVLFILVNYVLSKVEFDFDADFKTCPKTLDDIVDMSGLEIVAVNDTLNALNGTIKFLNDIKSPFRFEFKTERFIRGQWVNGEINRVVNDLCFTMNNPLDSIYTVTKNMKKKCPWKKGVCFLY